MDSQENDHLLKLGAAAAAILACSLGCLVIGILTLLVQISPAIAASLNWWSPVGPLSGETGLGIFAWLVSWILLHFILRKREPNMFLVGAFSFLFLALAMVLLFPPFYEKFH